MPRTWRKARHTRFSTWPKWPPVSSSYCCRQTASRRCRQSSESGGEDTTARLCGACGRSLLRLCLLRTSRFFCTTHLSDLGAVRLVIVVPRENVHLRFVAWVSEVFLNLKPDVFCVNLCLCVDTYAIACCMAGRRRSFCFSAALPVHVASCCAPSCRR